MEDHEYLEAKKHLKKYKIHLLDIPLNDQVYISEALHKAYEAGREAFSDNKLCLCPERFGDCVDFHRGKCSSTQI